MKKEYADLIIKHLSAKRIATSEEIAQLLGSSIATARRVTLNLEKANIIHRFHGGVMLEPAHLREADRDLEKTQKQEIAQYVAGHLIEDGQTIFIGSGTTTGMIGEFLNHFQDLTVITNNLLLYDNLLHFKHIQTIFTGGIFNPDTPSMVGAIYPLHYLTDRLIVDSAFVTSPYVSIHGCSQHESYIRQVIEEHFIGLSNIKSYLLANHEKLGKKKSFLWLPPQKFSVLITNFSSENSAPLEEVFKIIYCTQPANS